MEKYRNFSLLIILIPTPDFPPFLLYVRWKSGVTFVRRCFRDEGGRGVVAGGGGDSGGCKPRIEGIVKWACGFSQGDQSVCVNEGLKGCRSGVG